MSSKTEEEKRKINEKKKNTLKNFIDKYGKEVGTSRYREMLKKRMDSFNSIHPSTSCKNFLDDIERELNINIDRECFIDRFIVDGLYKNNVIEFSEDLSKRGTYVKLGDNCKEKLTEGETYTFDGFVHQKNNIFIFNPIL